MDWRADWALDETLHPEDRERLWQILAPIQKRLFAAGMNIPEAVDRLMPTVQRDTIEAMFRKAQVALEECRLIQLEAERACAAFVPAHAPVLVATP